MNNLLRKSIQILKWLWLIIMIGAALHYLSNHSVDISTQIQTIQKPRLFLAVSLLIFSKLLVIRMAQRALQSLQHPMAFTRILYIDSLSQLAKYLPGGIWHVVSRGSFYHADGLTVRETAHALAIENIWLVSGASIIGLYGCIIFYSPLPVLFPVIIGLLVIWRVGLRLVSDFFRIPQQLRLNTTNLLLQIAIWFARGTSLWIITLLPLDTRSFALIVGASCLGWTLGYLAVFAPGGIGIRETVTALLLIPILDPADTLIYTSIHRLLWIITELLFGIVAQGNASFIQLRRSK